MGIDEKLKEIKTKLPAFHAFMIAERRGGWYDMSWHTEPRDFRILDLEKKIAVYLLSRWESDRNDTKRSIRLGVYKKGITKDIFNADVYSYMSEDRSSYRSLMGSKLKGESGFGEFEPNKQYDKIEKVELKDKQLIITVHAPRNIYVDSEERVDIYRVDLDSVKKEVNENDIRKKN